MEEVNETIEKEFCCPFCGEEISVLLDLSVSNQTFIEDCEVCCRPIEIKYFCEANEVTSFDVSRAY